MAPKYSLVIRWSDEDQCYIAWIPEFGPFVKTHGDTYEKAARMGQEIIEMMTVPGRDSSSPLPEPWLFQDSDVDEKIGQKLFPKNGSYRKPTVKPSNVQVKNVTA